MNIKHIVLSGGAQLGFSIYGSLKYLIEHEHIDMAKIETMYATSAGSFVAVMVCLPIEANTIIEYMVNRPWDNVFPMHPSFFMEIYANKGIYDARFILAIFKPLFASCDISLDITMDEFFKLTKIEHHFYSTDLNNMELIDISYKTHPNMTLINALHMSSAIPYVIQPVFYDNKCCMDGGIISNFPINYCMRDTKCERSEILGIKTTSVYNKPTLDTSSNLFDMTYSFLYHTMNIISDDPDITMPHLIQISSGPDTPGVRESVMSRDKRQELLNIGISCAETFVNSMREH